MPPVKKNCPRCGELRFVGPWKSGTYTELCGGCKIGITLDPACRQRLATKVKAAASTLGVSVDLKFDLTEDQN